MRLDLALVAQNIYPTRAKAAAAIKAGLVSVNGVFVQKPSLMVAESDSLIGAALPYVSGRGSLKLARALEVFGISPVDCVCLDIGASTGGFTEVLLSHGARKVFAVDVGTAQLVPELREDARVVSLEQTDIRELKPIEPVDLVVIDVSFVSLADIVPCLGGWGAKRVVALIKPQFEVPRSVAAASGGVIKAQQWHQYAIQRATDAFSAAGYVRCGLIESPIRGGSGNIEYLAYFQSGV
ncbi:MAG: TlyA family RNA methyltransferase [Alphaproteobacteria bacterium]|nr:TlyA family RNA methyltransferase [Alphaproteobacteria bacterium]